MVGALASLFLGIMADSRAAPLRLQDHDGRIRDEKVLLGWLVLGICGVFFFSWLWEPGSPIGVVKYEEAVQEHFEGTPFAQAAWAVFVVLSLGLYAKLQLANRRMMRRLSRWLYFTGITLSYIYLLAHGRRGTPTGYLIVIYCCFGSHMSMKKKVFFVTTIGMMLAVIGYVRNLLNPMEYLVKEHLHLPGGPGNVLITYITGYAMQAHDLLKAFKPGETYMGWLMSIPPKFLGLYRPPTAYDYVFDFMPSLQGGAYFMMEPVMNFGVIGAVIYLILFIAIANWSIKKVRFFLSGNGSMFSFLIAGTFMTLIFKTMWYGLGSVIKGIFIAVMVGFTYLTVHCLIRAARVGEKKKSTRGGAAAS
jgi:hypothetical protein